ncbi:hypothetical protein IVB34_01770 [Bradyrhizobium sp. 2]|uniref:AraC-like ligand-binding domain-containing protein n=1 Tax=Bradyrhizobium sp. 2 TaxID=190045 RepID=UPI001FF77A8A|nr:hypothetical protein [Bradyrhizobium sp. 2]MCK1457117.1 hypothetical protein [Bradyrhizobium sp. 2]
MMHPSDDFLSAPELDYDGFRAAMREDWGWFTPARETNIFASKVRTRRLFGFAAVDLTCSATRLERTEQDIRRDNMEYYFVTVQDTGESIIIHNDRVVNVTAGDVVLLDSTKPVTFISRAQDSARWLGVQVPRQKLASHLGFEPQGGVCGPRQAQASRLLCQLALDPISDAEPAFASTDNFMHLVVYDLLGALFAPPAPLGSRHNDKLFMRVCGIIKDRFADPDISAGGGCRGGNFTALFAETVHGPWVDMRSLHMFGPSGSCGASDRTPRVDEDRSAAQRYCLRLRLSRLHAFCARLPPAFRHRAGRRRSRRHR